MTGSFVGRSSTSSMRCCICCQSTRSSYPSAICISSRRLTAYGGDSSSDRNIRQATSAQRYPSPWAVIPCHYLGLHPHQIIPTAKKKIFIFKFLNLNQIFSPRTIFIFEIVDFALHLKYKQKNVPPIIIIMIMIIIIIIITSMWQYKVNPTSILHCPTCRRR